MTLGWGAACVDGIVIATDAMRLRWDDQARPQVRGRLDGEWKLGRIGERIAFMRSGSFVNHAVRSDLTGTERTWTLEEIAWQVFTELAAHQVAQPQRPRREAPDEIELLIGGGPSGLVPELLWLRSTHKRIERVPIGSTIEIACMAWDKPEPMTHVSDELTTDVALGVAISATHRYVRSLYRSWGFERLGDFAGALGVPGGPLPPVAFPLAVAVITAEDLRCYEVGLPGDLTAEDFDRSRVELASPSELTSSSLERKEELRGTDADTSTATA